MESEEQLAPAWVNIHEAKTNLSRLIEKALRGEPVVIARAGTPLVKLVPVDAPAAIQRKRLGFLAGVYQVPDAEAFNTMGQHEIEALFGGEA